MSGKIVLVSDDLNFFEYIKTKLELRKSDELFTFSFDVIPEKMHLIESSVLIIDSENSAEKVLDLLKIFRNNPVIVFAYNDDDVFKRKCYRAGMFDFVTLLTPDSDFRARMIPALSVASLLEKNKRYREILAQKNIITSDNEVFIDYNFILDKELEEINKDVRKAVFVAISPSEQTKFLIQPSLLEAIILNHVRKNDILMNYAANKYFLLMYDIDITAAQKLWEKILKVLPVKVYAGFCSISNQKRQQLINEVLNKLHTAINSDKDIVSPQKPINSLSMIQNVNSTYSNFKMFRQEFGKKIEQVITPVFYQIQQKYSGRLAGVNIEQGSGEGYGTFYIKGKNFSSCFRITSPGFSKINIDITYQKDLNNVDAKRITLEPEELETWLLSDLLEQFVHEYKRGCEDDS